MAKRAVVSAGGGFNMCFFSLEKVEIAHRGFAIQSGWADAFALQKDVLSQFNAPPTPI